VSGCLDLPSFRVREWELHLCHARRLKVVDDSVDTIFQEILTEIDQEA
jgi:hypothetical protein